MNFIGIVSTINKFQYSDVAKNLENKVYDPIAMFDNFQLQQKLFFSNLLFIYWFVYFCMVTRKIMQINASFISFDKSNTQTFYITQ